MGRSCVECAFARATRRTGPRASFEGLSIVRRCFTINRVSRVARGVMGRGRINENDMTLTSPLFAPHRPSTPIVLLPSQLPVRQGVPTDRNPISQSLTSGGTQELRARAISDQVLRERCYNAVLGRRKKKKGTDEAPTRREDAIHTRPLSASQAIEKVNSPQLLTSIVGPQTARCSRYCSTEEGRK